MAADVPIPPPATGSTALDAFNVIIALGVSAGLTGSSAEMFSAYTLIFGCACGGAAFSAATREGSSTGSSLSRWLSTCGHIAMMVGIALVCTVPLVEVLSGKLHQPAGYLYGPVAAVIAARPVWVFKFLHRWARVKLGLPADKETLK